MAGARARQRKNVSETDIAAAPQSQSQSEETSLNVIRIENLRPGAGGHLDNLLTSCLLPLALLTSMLTSADPVSSVFRNLCSSSLGLILVTSHTYIRDIWRRDDTIQGNLSLTHLLLVASYAALGLMLGLEMLRVSELIPLVSTFLTQRLRPFLDTKDSGRLILTNIYLLIGLSLPLWTDPGPVSVFASSSLNLYSGLISVGVADTAAAVIGKIYSSF